MSEMKDYYYINVPHLKPAIALDDRRIVWMPTRRTSLEGHLSWICLGMGGLGKHERLYSSYID